MAVLVVVTIVMARPLSSCPLCSPGSAVPALAPQSLPSPLALALLCPLLCADSACAPRLQVLRPLPDNPRTRVPPHHVAPPHAPPDTNAPSPAADCPGVRSRCAARSTTTTHGRSSTVTRRRSVLGTPTHTHTHLPTNTLPTNTPSTCTHRSVSDPPPTPLLPPPNSARADPVGSACRRPRRPSTRSTATRSRSIIRSVLPPRCSQTDSQVLVSHGAAVCHGRLRLRRPRRRRRSLTTRSKRGQR